jgi:hypothetical protein
MGENLPIIARCCPQGPALKKFTEDALTEHKKNGRLPNYSKAYFVTGLANLWRIMTGEDASRDLAAPFATFVSAAWASLGKDLPEISWANQIRRRKDTLSAAELVTWVDQIRHFPVKQFHFAKQRGLHPDLPLKFSTADRAADDRWMMRRLLIEHWRGLRPKKVG